jgi:hypothetical protein
MKKWTCGLRNSDRRSHPMTLKTKISEFDAEKIDAWEPCYPASKHIKPGEIHTVITLLDRKDIPFDDRLWVIMRDELVSDKLMRLFAVWCARQVQHLMKDERSIKALDVVEAFANGNATKEELAAAWAAALGAALGAAGSAARDAAESAARDAAESAARDAARAAAWAAAWAAALGAALGAAESVARDAAWAAALGAAGSAARDAAESAARDAAESAARDAARAAAWAAAWAAALGAALGAARAAQENKLREMLIEGIETGDVK